MGEAVWIVAVAVLVIVAFVALSGANWRGVFAGIFESRAARTAREQEANRKYEEWCACVDAERAKEIAKDEAEWQAYAARMEARS